MVFTPSIYKTYPASTRPPGALARQKTEKQQTACLFKIGRPFTKVQRRNRNLNVLEPCGKKAQLARFVHEFKSADIFFVLKQLYDRICDNIHVLVGVHAARYG